jgi:hypothetical protein
VGHWRAEDSSLLWLGASEHEQEHVPGREHETAHGSEDRNVNANSRGANATCEASRSPKATRKGGLQRIALEGNPQGSHETIPPGTTGVSPSEPRS